MDGISCRKHFFGFDMKHRLVQNVIKPVSIGGKFNPTSLPSVVNTNVIMQLKEKQKG